MSYNALVYRVMIASPSDVIKEPEIIREAIREWNAVHSVDKEIVLIPVSWNYDTSPTMGKHPQEVIDKHILDTADLLVAIFWTRLGTPTRDAISGTVGEIQKHIEAGKPTMIYFSNESIKPDKFDQEQYEALMGFKQECQDNGLLEEFETSDDFAKDFSRHLGIKINRDEYFVKSVEEEIAFYKDDEQETINLSQEADLLLTEASKDAQGKIQKITFLMGFEVIANGKKLNEESTPRSKAIWDSAFDELLELDFIDEKGYEGQIYTVTQKGYEYVDNK